MEIYLPQEVIDKMCVLECESPFIQERKGSWQGMNVETQYLSKKDLKIMRGVASSIDEPKARTVITKLNILDRVKTTGAKPIKHMETLTELCKGLVITLPNKRVYRIDGFGNLFPYYVKSITFNKRKVTRDYVTPAHIDFNFMYHSRGNTQTTTSTVWDESVSGQGATAVSVITEILELLIENDDLNAEYEKQLKMYEKYKKMTGYQFTVMGTVEEDGQERRWRSSNSKVKLPPEGIKAVMDDEEKQGDNSIFYATKGYWGKEKKTKKNAEDYIEDGPIVQIPIKPMLRMFNLSTHTFFKAHVNQVKLYRYDSKVIDKLILPDSKKNLLKLLVDASRNEGNDIIKGKSGGIIVLSSGTPGTGKTLTAEVYSEASRKALYVVQCSQLGISAEELEEKLTEVLERASRWGIILLIDEADVYIHERGSNLEQNAIVGVFLRLLEYYSGILFLTTNRATIIDDAIISRITAHLRYTLPDKSQRRMLWNVLSEQHKLHLDNLLIKELVTEFKVSGRTIRQIIRLAKVMIDGNKVEPTLELFKEIAEYQDTEDAQAVKSNGCTTKGCPNKII